MSGTDDGLGPRSRIVVRQDPVYRRRRAVVLGAGALALLLALILILWQVLGRGDDEAEADPAGGTSTGAPTTGPAEATAPQAAAEGSTELGKM